MFKMGIMEFMETQKQIESDFKDALRSGDELKKRTLRLVLSSLKLVEVDQGEPLQEQDVLGIVRKEIKSRRASIADAERAERPDITAEAEAEIRILQVYLPQSLSEDELEAMAKEAIAEVEASSPQEMGNVMKVLMPRVQGRADGSQVSQVVRDLLAGG
jgi:uncharacterized protein YqeY